MSERFAIRMNAFCQAMRARAGVIERMDVRMLADRAQHLDPSDRLAIGISQFAAGFEGQRPDVTQMAELGAELVEVVRLDTLPDPVDAQRRDIYG